MKTRSQTLSTVTLVTIGLAASTAALADPPHWANANQYRQHQRHDDYQRERARDSDFARVIDVDPIIRRVRVSSPQQECWNEDRAVSPGPSRTEVRSTLIGGLIGAAVGHQISELHHLHDPVAIVGGSLIGAAIGNNIGVHKAERRGEYRDVGYESVQRCQASYKDEWSDEIDGYRVTYVYHGREYTTRMPYDPGARMRVDVNIQPAFDRN